MRHSVTLGLCATRSTAFLTSRAVLLQVQYAIKKVCLWDGRKDAYDTVMREVVSLARLDHTNVVRYYQAWQEIVDGHEEEDGDEFSDEGDGDSSVSESVGSLSASASASASRSVSPRHRRRADRPSLRQAHSEASNWSASGPQFGVNVSTSVASLSPSHAGASHAESAASHAGGERERDEKQAAEKKADRGQAVVLYIQARSAPARSHLSLSLFVCVGVRRTVWMDC